MQSTIKWTCPCHEGQNNTTNRETDEEDHNSTPAVNTRARDFNQHRAGKGAQLKIKHFSERQMRKAVYKAFTITAK